MLKRLRVRGYELFRDSDLVFEPLTVLVGANGSGETALWEVMTLLSMLANGQGLDEELDSALKQRASGGAAGLLSWDRSDRSLSLELEVDDYAYEVRFEEAGVPGATTFDTRLEVLRRGGATCLELSSLEGTRKDYTAHQAPLTMVSFRHPLALPSLRATPGGGAALRVRRPAVPRNT